MKIFGRKSRKVGLVLSGGFLGGAFQAGAQKAIREAGINIDYVGGSSVGALNAAMFTVGKNDELIDMWLRIKRSTIYNFKFRSMFKLLYADSIASNEPLKRLVLESAEKDIEAFFMSSTQCDILTTNINLRQEEVFSNRRKEDIEHPERLIKAVVASCAIPFWFPPEKIGDYLYWDGSVLNLAPVDKAVEAGCQTIFAILTDSGEPVAIENNVNFIDAVLHLVALNRVNQPSQRYLEKLDETTKPQLIVIRPEKDFEHTIPFKNSHFEQVPEMIEMGYNMAKEKIESLRRKKILKV